MRSAAALLLLLASAISLGACRHRVPDVGAFEAILVADGRVNELLTEADRRSDADPAATSRDLRALVLPLAEANRVHAARLQPEHPRARELQLRLARAMELRARSIEAYANALSPRDDAALVASLRQQREVQESLAALETDVHNARTAPAEVGCSVAHPGARAR